MLIAAIILLGLSNIAATLLLFALQRRAVENFARDLQDRAATELAALVKGEPCQSASVLLAIGRSVGSEAGRSAKASLMADLGHAARATNAAAEDAVVDEISAQKPMLGAVLGSMGRGKRSKLLNHPLAAMGMQLLMGGGLDGSTGQTGNNHDNHSSVLDRLRHQA
jgi:hypothetical protein